jgi:predicted transcriptional regulator
MGNPRAKLDHIDKPSISASILKAGRQPIYLNNALYPIISIQVRLREKSREQMGDIEATILKLCAIGVADLEKMSFAMGIAQQRLAPIVSEIIGRGLLRVTKDTTFLVTELGKLSLEHGCEVVETDRSVLICGITGRLLPKNIYSMNLITAKDLKEIVYIPDLIQESFTIPLRALDLSAIPNKKSVNLPDETISIVGVIEESAEPNFISTVVAIHQAPGEKAKCELHYKGGTNTRSNN